MLNPFFLQGNGSEQNLIQDLINEQIQMYGIECIYMPRIFVNEKTIMKEVTTSEFTKSFPIEAYMENYDGYVGNDITLSKFGIRTQDQTTLVISRERFETYISVLLAGTANSKLTTRPKEGDLIYFPISNSLMEIKYVEDRDPFYQLQKNYVYKLTCEVFEYEDEKIDVNIPEINNIVDDKGYLTTLKLVGVGTTASAIATWREGGVYSITLVDDGSGYETTPTIRIQPPSSGQTASAVAITTANALGSKSIETIYITNPGYGYTFIPTITFVGGLLNGNPPIAPAFATAAVGIGSTGGVVGVVTITNAGANYASPPTITFSAPGPSYGITATGIAVLNNLGAISNIRITNSGYGYTQSPTITIGAGSTLGIGTFFFGDLIKGASSLTTAFVKDWDVTTYKLRVNDVSGAFTVGEIITTPSSDAAYQIGTINYQDEVDPYAENDIFETESDAILDFTESNPFGEV